VHLHDLPHFFYAARLAPDLINPVAIRLQQPASAANAAQSMGPPRGVRQLAGNAFEAAKKAVALGLPGLRSDFVTRDHQKGKVNSRTRYMSCIGCTPNRFRRVCAVIREPLACVGRARAGRRTGQ
jgi:hypothetical protein